MPDDAPTVATAEVALLHVPPAVGWVSVAVPPTHIVPAPAMGGIAGAASVTSRLAFFHWSLEPDIPSKFTTFIVPLSVTLPVPVGGAVQGIFTTYVLPTAPVPVVAGMALLCSIKLTPPTVAECVPAIAVIVPALAVLVLADNWKPKRGNKNGVDDAYCPVITMV